MFVFKSTYEALESRHLKLTVDYELLLAKWTALVREINKKGGREFLDNARIGVPELTKADIRTLVKLCHPDKHGNCPQASEITAKLLRLR